MSETNTETRLLPQTNNLESLKVGQSTSLLNLVPLLCPAALLPLGIYTSSLPCLLDSTRSCSAWKLCKDDWGKDEMWKSDWLAWDIGTINENLGYNNQYLVRYATSWAVSFTYSLVIDDLDDCSQLSVGRSSLNESDTTDLYQSPWRCLDVYVSHFECLDGRKISKILREWFWELFDNVLGVVVESRVCCLILSSDATSQPKKMRAGSATANS